MKDYYAVYETGKLPVATASLMHGVEYSLITYIWTVPAHRGRGHANRLLGLVCNAADHEQVTLLLSVAPDEEGVDPHRLRRWYRTFGFYNFEGAMRRDPVV